MKKKLFKHQKTGKKYYLEEPPESFFHTLVPESEKQKGMIFVNDKRLPSFEVVNGKNVYIGTRYAFPTDLAKELSDEYPLGLGPQSLEIIPWKNGQILTIIHNNSMDNIRFDFEFWASLTREPESDPPKAEEFCTVCETYQAAEHVRGGVCDACEAKGDDPRDES